MQNDDMPKKSSVLTVRLSDDLKRRAAARAKRERRSVSAQVEHELERALADERPSAPSRARTALGMFEGARLPSEDDFAEVRRLVWDRLSSRS